LAEDQHLVAREDETSRDQLRAVDYRIDPVLETGDIRFGHLSSRGRMPGVTLVGEVLEGESVLVQESYDGGGTWEAGSRWGLLPEDETQLRHAMVRPKAARVRLRVSLLNFGNTDSDGLRLNGLTLEYRPSAGTQRLAGNRR